MSCVAIKKYKVKKKNVTPCTSIEFAPSAAAAALSNPSSCSHHHWRGAEPRFRFAPVQAS